MIAFIMAIAMQANLPPLVKEINAYRKLHGVAELTFNPQLQLAAYHHTKDMSERKSLDHTGADGSSFGARARKSGFDMTSGGEIIAPTDDPKEAVRMWSQSPGHNSQMLDITRTYFGAASYMGYSCAVFGNAGKLGNTVNIEQLPPPTQIGRSKRKPRIR